MCVLCFHAFYQSWRYIDICYITVAIQVKVILNRTIATTYVQDCRVIIAANALLQERL
jgi:hypothetical protein